MSKSFLLHAFLATNIAALVTANNPGNFIVVPLTRNEDLSAYYAELSVGTPPQNVSLKVDSGSPTYSFISSENPSCTTFNCNTYGTFSNTSSTTSLYQGTGFRNALQNSGQGDYLNDTVRIGSVSTPDLYFGYITKYGFPDRLSNPVGSILGLSLFCQFAGPECTWAGPYLLPQLKNASTIDRVSTSYYLGPDVAEPGNAHMILGGAYDKAKVDGEFFNVDMVDPFNLALAGGQTNSVNVTKVEVVAESKTTSRSFGEQGSPVLLDTGVASWYLTPDLVDAVIAGLGGAIGEAVPGRNYQIVDCKFRDPNTARGYVRVEFGNAGHIDVPLHALVTQFADNSCGSFVIARGDTLSIFGDAFLRSTYSVFDQERFIVSLAQVRHTEDEDIVSIPTGGIMPPAPGPYY